MVRGGCGPGQATLKSSARFAIISVFETLFLMELGGLVLRCESESVLLKGGFANMTFVVWVY